MGEGELIRLEDRDAVAVLTLASPPLNILTCAMMDQVAEAVERVAGDDSVKALAVLAEGKAFSAGADVGEHSPELAPKLIASFSRMFRALGGLEVPILMGVGGAALGAGFELALAADVLVASERAKFGQPEILLGFFAPVGVAWLPALVGPAKAAEICCAGRTYPAQAMKEMGLVTEVVPADDLDAAVEGWMKDFRKTSPKVMRLNVRMLKALRNRSFEEARLEAERVFLEELMPLEDVSEGIAAFMEKRRPEWRNR